MIAREYNNFVIQMYIIHADGTFACAFWAEHLFVKLLLRESSDSIWWSGTRGIRTLMLLH